MGGGNPVLSHQLSCKPKTTLRNKVCVRQRTMLSQEVRQEKEAAEKQSHPAEGPRGRRKAAPGPLYEPHPGQQATQLPVPTGEFTAWSWGDGAAV